MMGANEDWVNRSHVSQGDRLQRFLTSTQLIDPFYSKFSQSPRTYVEGTNRLDYIFIDPALELAVKHTGYLGSAEANFSDHAMAFIDFDEKKLFRGIINRPTEISSREFLLEQENKKRLFTTAARTLYHQHKIIKRVMELAATFAESGATPDNIVAFGALDKEIIELTKAAAKKAGRKNYGYMRSEDLTDAADSASFCTNASSAANYEADR